MPTRAPNRPKRPTVRSRPPGKRRPPAAQPTRARWPLPLAVGVLLGVVLSVGAQRVLFSPSAVVAELPEPPIADANYPQTEYEFFNILTNLDQVIPTHLLPQTEAPADKVPEAPPIAEPVPPGAHYFVQAGSFKSSQDANRMRARLLLLGFDVIVQAVDVEGVRYHRVRIGPFDQRADIRVAEARLQRENIQYLVLQVRDR